MSLTEHSLDKLATMMELNEPLYRAYLLKEEMRWFWSLPGAEVAESFLETWANEAYVTSIKQFEKLADSFLGHKAGLLSYFAHRISNRSTRGAQRQNQGAQTTGIRLQRQRVLQTPSLFLTQ